MTMQIKPEELDARMMDRALEEAARGKPSPNPPVGAVVAQGAEIVAVGHHERAGDEHAEVAALRSAGERARGGTLYVTLEPCNHNGRTPPCTEAVLASGVARIVIGCSDPNPHVRGGGIARLRKAGIEVIEGVREREARARILPWTTFITQGLPHVILKLALSLDGRIAARTGASKWVTGTEARAKVHALRARMDAVAVGIGTVLADDPRLTVRDAPGASPIRVVFDTKLRIPLTGQLVASAREAPVWVLTSTEASEDAEQALLEKGLEVFRVPPSAEGRIDIQAALRALAQRGVVTLMVEGGAELAGSLLAARHAAELHAFIAPLLLGPRGRPGAVDWAGPDTPTEAPRIVDPRWELCGRDAYVSGSLIFPPRPA